MKTKIIFVILSTIYLFTGCSERQEEKDNKELKKILAKIEFESFIYRPIDECAVLLANKYNVSDTLCRILIYSYYNGVEFRSRELNSSLNSSLIKIDSAEVNFNGITGTGMKRFIEAACLKLQVEKNLIVSILYDFILITKEDNSRKSINGYSVLISEKYRMSDTLCKIIINSYLNAANPLEYLLNRNQESASDTSLLIKSESSGILFNVLSGQEMNEFIETVSLKLNLEKRLVSSVLYDFLSLYRSKEDESS